MERKQYMLQQLAHRQAPNLLLYVDNNMVVRIAEYYIILILPCLVYTQKRDSLHPATSSQLYKPSLDHRLRSYLF